MTFRGNHSLAVVNLGGCQRNQLVATLHRSEDIDFRTVVFHDVSSGRELGKFLFTSTPIVPWNEDISARNRRLQNVNMEHNRILR